MNNHSTNQHCMLLYNFFLLRILFIWMKKFFTFILSLYVDFFSVIRLFKVRNKRERERKKKSLSTYFLFIKSNASYKYVKVLTTTKNKKVNHFDFFNSIWNYNRVFFPFPFKRYICLSVGRKIENFIFFQFFFQFCYTVIQTQCNNR